MIISIIEKIPKEISGNSGEKISQEIPQEIPQGKSCGEILTKI